MAPARPTNCFHCHKISSSSSPPLQRCSRCQTLYYCSRTCQSSDWPKHKKECSLFASGDVAPLLQYGTLDTSPLPPNDPHIRSGEALRSQEQSSDHEDMNKRSNTIYYLKQSVPALSMMDFSGPYATLERLASQIISILLSESKNLQATETAISEIVSRLERTPRCIVRGPFDQPVEFEVIKEMNEAVKRVLPEKVKEVFVVFSTKTDPGGFEIEDVQVHGSFIDKNLVEDRWEEVLDEYEEEMGVEWQIGADFDKLDGPGGLYGHVKGKTAADGFRRVQVRKGFEEIGDLHML